MTVFFHVINKANTWQFLLSVAAILLLSSDPSFAQNFSGVQTFVGAVVTAITGPIGQSVSALAVIAVGFSFMTGRMDWTFAVAVVMGIAIVFGGATFVNGVVAH